jgi:limonene-1,2-epoxide hydrolase
MRDSPESVARSFLASWENASVEKLSGFFSEDAVFTDPRGVQSGLDAIKKLWEGDLQMTPSTTVDIRSIASNGGTVMVERVDTWPMQGKTLSLENVGVFEVGGDGLIKRYSYYYDSKSIADQLKAAGIAIPI